MSTPTRCESWKQLKAPHDLANRLKAQTSLPGCDLSEVGQRHRHAGVADVAPSRLHRIMSRLPSRRLEAAKIAAILIAVSLTLTSGRTPALAQPAERHALAYISIPLDGSTKGMAYGLRLDLGNKHGAEPAGYLGPRSDDPPPVLELRFGLAEEPGELHLGGIAPATMRDRLDLDGGASLWIWTGVGIAAVVAMVVAADTICIGINTSSCSKDKDDNSDKDEDTNEPTQR